MKPITLEDDYRILNTSESMECVDLVDTLMGKLSVGQEPTGEEINRASELGVNLSEIREVVGATYGDISTIDED